MSILPPRLSLEAGGSQHIPLLLSTELLGPCPSHKPRLGTPSVPFQVGEVLEEHGESPRRLGLISHFHRGGGAGWQPEQQQQESLSPAPSTSPGVRVGAGVPRPSSMRGENHGRANRKAPSPCAACPGLQSGGCRDFPSLPPGRLQGRAISSCEAGEASAAPAGPQEAAGHERVAAGGQAGARR